MPLHIAEFGPGSAPTIVFLHGGGVGGWMWRAQAEALQADYHCLVPDLPEHGQSGDVKPFTILDAARRIADLIHKRAHGGRAHIVGLSLGGQVGVALLGLAPRLVDHALVSGTLLRPLPGAGLLGLTMKLYAPLKDRAFMIRANMRQLQVPAAYFGEFAADTRRLDVESFSRIMAANLSFSMPPGLTRLANPTLVCVGENEPGVMRRSACALVAAMPGASGRLVERAGHNWSLRAPALFNQTLRAWLAGQPLPSGLRILRGKG